MRASSGTLSMSSARVRYLGSLSRKYAMRRELGYPAMAAYPPNMDSQLSHVWQLCHVLLDEQRQRALDSGGAMEQARLTQRGAAVGDQRV